MITRKDPLVAAKACVEKACGGEERRWLKLGPITPYQNICTGGLWDAVEVWLLEGTPFRGFVIAWYENEKIGQTRAYDSQGKTIRKFHRWN